MQIWLAFCLLVPTLALAESVPGPRAYLRSDSGFLQPEKLVIDGKTIELSNPLISTYDIEDFQFLKETDPEAWRSLYNHYRYGVAGTRGLLGGIVGAALIIGFGRGQVNAAVPAGVFLAGFIYSMNCRHMAKHNLHKAVNQLNGVTDIGRVPEIQFPLLQASF